MHKNVLVLGASSNPERYSNKAIKMLQEFNHDVVAVSPRNQTIHGVDTISDLASVKNSVHTITIYVNPKILAGYVDDILKLRPERVVFNPGTRDINAMTLFQNNGVEVVEACTLVLLRTGQF